MPVKDAFLAGVLAHVPEADRGKVEAALVALEEDGLRQADYSKVSAEAQAAKAKFDELYTKNTEWFQERQADLAALDALRVENADLKTKVTTVVTDPTKPVVDAITKKQLDDTLGETERGAVSFIAEANSLTLKHFKEFGEVLDITDLLKDKRVQQIGLRGVYADTFKDQLKAKADAAEAARVDAIRKEERTKVLAEVAGAHHPYPVVGNESSSLDAIEAARAGQSPAVKSVEDMTSEYARLTAARTAVPV